MFSALLNSRHLPKNTKLLIYKVAIRSVLIYAFPIWFTVSPSVAKKLEIFERSVLRKCINKNFASYTKRHSNAVIYEDSAVTPLCTYALALQRKFAEKLGTHDNSYVFDHEKDADWSSCRYLSPVGILRWDHDTPTLPGFLSDFFIRTLPD
mgnify:CR=1 FL=1